jgi:mannose-6-phosphate isomerase
MNTKGSPVPLILELPANRVRRNYRGGRMLDELEGRPNLVDSDQPEDWIASTVVARNPGLALVENEGLSTVVSADGHVTLLRNLFATHSSIYLGTAHTATLGNELGFLVKLLDSSMRLHVQAHPTATFARQHLNSRWGKLETYVVLGIRQECNDPSIRLGFQHAVGPREWQSIVMEQDIAAMDACFEPVPVKAGDVWVVPGGVPHAIGEGLLLIEILEPTDLVVRCEFEREGIVVPPEARFMQGDPEFALRIFDHTEYTVAQITERCRVTTEQIFESRELTITRLVGPRQTECFEVERYVVHSGCSVRTPAQVLVAVVTKGAGTVAVGDEHIDVRRGSRFVVAAAAELLSCSPDTGAPLEIVMCRPGSSLG